MTYTIQYRNRSNEIIDLEWCVPKGWGEQAIRDAFAMQYGTQNEIITIKRI